VFYGWIVVGVAFAAQFIAAGLVFYTFGVALKSLAVDFDAGRLGISGIHLVMPWTGALMAPFLGRLVGAGYLRVLLTAGAVSTGLGFCLISQASELWHLYVIYPVLMAFGANTLSGVGASALVVNWFSRLRATALGVSQIGASAGGMVMGPVATSLFAEHGWRNVYLGFGVAVLALAPVIAWLTVGRPEERGLRPDGDHEPVVASGTPLPPPALTTGEALRSANLWLIAFIAGTGFMLSSAIVTHIVAFATDQGLDAMQASGLLSVMALGALAGKLLFGFLSDRWGERGAYALAIGLELLGLLGLTTAPTGTAVYAVMAVFGLGIGGNLPLSAALLARAFGPAAFGPMMGLMAPLLTPIVSAGTPFAGWVYDDTGSYTLAFGTFALLAAGSVLALWRVRLPEEPATVAAALPDPVPVGKA
jgi:MFS family permease